MFLGPPKHLPYPMLSHVIPFYDLLGIATTSQVKSRQIGSKMGSLQAVLIARWRAPGGFGNQSSDWPVRMKHRSLRSSGIIFIHI